MKTLIALYVKHESDTDTKLRKMRHKFRKIDVNGDGFISRDELVNALVKYRSFKGQRPD